MSILVHDGKQKKMYFDLANYRPSNFLLQKIIFNEIGTVVSMWKHYSKWRLANSTMSGLYA